MLLSSLKLSTRNVFGIKEITLRFFPYGANVAEQGMSLRTITVRWEVKAQYKASFAINDEPNIMLFTVNFNYCLISVLIIRIKIHSRYKLHSNTVKNKSKLLAPISYDNMGNLDILKLWEHERYTSSGAFTNEELV